MAIRVSAAQSQYVDCGEGLSMLPGSGLSLTARIRLTEYDEPPGQSSIIVRRYFWNNCYQLAVDPTGEVRFSIWDDMMYEHSWVTIERISLGGWHTVEATWDGEIVRVWLDGTIALEESWSGTAWLQPCPVQIGANYGWDFFTGDLDNIRIYNRGLSAAEAAIVRAGGELPNGCVLWLKFNEKGIGEYASGQGSIIDYSGYENHGTPENEPMYVEGIYLSPSSPAKRRAGIMHILSGRRR